MPMVAAGLPIAVLATMFGSTPAAVALGDREMQSLIQAGATPWEIEQQIRVQAQRQVETLHRCFESHALLACQKPGFVGVGLSLSKQGEILSHWVSRSTYAADCTSDQLHGRECGAMVFRASARADAAGPAHPGQAHQQALASAQRRGLG